MTGRAGWVESGRPPRRAAHYAPQSLRCHETAFQDPNAFDGQRDGVAELGDAPEFESTSLADSDGVGRVRYDSSAFTKPLLFAGPKRLTEPDDVSKGSGFLCTARTFRVATPKRTPSTLSEPACRIQRLESARTVINR